MDQTVTVSPAMIEVQSDEGQIIGYQNFDELRLDILAGNVRRDQQGRKNAPGIARPGKWVTVEKLAKHDFKTRCLYAPVWAHTMKGFMIGWLAGFILKSIDSAFLFFAADGLAGLLWVVFIAGVVFSFIPKTAKASWVAVGAGIIAIMIGYGNYWLSAIAVGLVALLGMAPFGMAVGTIVGYARHDKIQPAPDAQPEGVRPAMLGIVLPVLVGGGFLAFYFLWLSPMLLEWLGA